MHEIQKHIFRVLSTKPKARFADLKPKSIEGNLFTYHLKTLLRQGYIETSAFKYRLSPTGKRLLDRISFETFQERIQPKIVTIIVIEHNKKFLLYKRRRSPFIHHIGFPYGKIHLGEHLEEAAQRELEEKTGLKAKLKQRGIVYLTVFDETELVSHMLCHVFVGKNPTGLLRTDTTIGTCFWGDLDQFPKNSLMPGNAQILKLIKKSSASRLFFEEYFLNTSEEN